ncbi:hypothetical protein NDU88_001342 [Pleurodeles waltl]|uniref:Uncharacterized protein n=1 Tax=Pleurodeles waltl TaxID=8319 RepID=A0AAV7Q3D4_PLEWA|nr:hypothetical protein NDU88_001342 [Pleurodeles waltl]
MVRKMGSCISVELDNGDSKKASKEIKHKKLLYMAITKVLGAHLMASTKEKICKRDYMEVFKLLQKDTGKGMIKVVEDPWTSLALDSDIGRAVDAVLLVMVELTEGPLVRSRWKACRQLWIEFVVSRTKYKAGMAVRLNEGLMW